MQTGFMMDARTFERTERAVRMVENQLTGRESGPQLVHNHDLPPAAVACLLELLPNGGQARAELLRYESLRTVHDVAVVGYPDDMDGDGFGRWRVRMAIPGGGATSWSDWIDATATAKQVQATLRQLPEWRQAGVQVTLGSWDGNHRMRWRLSVLPHRSGIAWPPILLEHQLNGTHVDLVTQPVPWVGTWQQVDVHCTLPLGQEITAAGQHRTRLPAGTQLAVVWFPGMGYGLQGAEIRKFERLEPIEGSDDGEA